MIEVRVRVFVRRGCCWPMVGGGERGGRGGRRES